MPLRFVAIAFALLVVSTHAHADEVSAAYDALDTTDRRLQLTLAIGGATSTLAGAALCGFSRYDHALQVAGGVTLVFGVADLAAGVAGVLAVNLGFDAGFMFAGLTAVAASRLGVDHRDRWLGGGVATVTQGVFAAAVDLIGMLAAKRAYRPALAHE
jgi:hypothetical protein